MRDELRPSGLEIVTVSLELSGPDASRRYIEAGRAAAKDPGSVHPSLLDPTHRLDALFGVVNIPNVIWIDEAGTIVRPPEPGWPGGRQEFPKDMAANRPEMGAAKGAPESAHDMWDVLGSGQDRRSYPDAIRDWVAKGAASEFAMTPEQVVAASEPRDKSMSAGAAHFELANHFWREGDRAAAIEHFNICHRLQPDNWTYQRQAWSLVGNERVGGDYGRFAQGPLVGEEDDWPFETDFRSEVSSREIGSYYPKTI